MDLEPQDRLARQRELFSEALLLPEENRAAFLDRECRDDPGLRDAVEKLLTNHLDDDFLAGPGIGFSEDEVAEEPGTRIGRYRLVEEIGRGGMGVVFRAEQDRPVKREVALKVIKAGMDTREVITRFEAERQALALMDHPNIAKVLDAGSTESGRPYFVMEFVRGEPIQKFCDSRRLGTRQRLELFMTVCQAIQHAHQKGIIHRDIKPSNILASGQGDHVAVKVIDFGIAKAVEQRLTDHTLVTRLEQFVGTPAYVSPEQADSGTSDIDTRSDVYSLGALLYELLTGKPPFDHATLLQAGYEEIRRIIREERPLKPSHAPERAFELGTGIDRDPLRPRSGAIESGTAGRSRLDCAQGAREGSRTPLRNSQCARRRRGTLPAPGAGDGRRSDRRLPVFEVRLAEQGGALDRRRLRGGVARRDDRQPVASLPRGRCAGGFASLAGRTRI